MTELTQREYLRKLAPDFSVLEMLEQAYYQGQTDKLNNLGKGIFYYPGNPPVLYRAMFLFDEPERSPEGVVNKYFNNTDNFVYEVYNFGDRFVAISVLIDRLFKDTKLPESGIIVNSEKYSNVFGVGF